jgi:hypothetical protein
LKGNLKVSLQAFHQDLTNEPSAEGVKVLIPADLGRQLARQPALVIRVEH